MEVPSSVPCVLFAIAAVLQLLGVALILLEMRVARRLAKSPNRNIIDAGGADGVSILKDDAGDVLDFLLDARARQGWAVAVLVVGILFGTAGNFAALHIAV